MVAQTVKVVNEQGLHMRPAGVFAKEMTKFSCAVTLDVAGKKINAKSVMLIIAACMKENGSEFFVAEKTTFNYLYQEELL